MKFIGAYSYHSSIWYNPSLMTLAQKLGLGPPTKMRPEALIFGYQALQGWTVMDRLSEIKVPTLVVAGRYDFLFPPEHQAILVDRLPNSQLELIERAGHNPQVEQPAEVIKAIRRFLA
jgi:proline iminopeptidase